MSDIVIDNKGNIISYKDVERNDVPYPHTAQGPATIVDPGSAEEDRDERLGFTHPNLHRRIDPKDENKGEYEFKARKYQLMVQGVNSYQTTTQNVHDDWSDDSEIP